MTTPKFIIALLTISFLTSCRGIYRFSEKEHYWMPYKGNETLVFSSNTGDTDTIFFLQKDTLIAYPEAQSLNGKTYEVARVFCRHCDASPPDGYHRYLDNDFVELKKSKDKKGRLHFNPPPSLVLRISRRRLLRACPGVFGISAFVGVPEESNTPLLVLCAGIAAG